MGSGRVVIAIILMIVISYTYVAAGDLQPRQVAPQDKCPVCGMFVAKYPDFVAQIVFKDGSQVFFDGVKDMMKYYFNLPKYNPAKTTADIGAILVSDYYKLTVIDGPSGLVCNRQRRVWPHGQRIDPVSGRSCRQGI